MKVYREVAVFLCMLTIVWGQRVAKRRKPTTSTTTAAPVTDPAPDQQTPPEIDWGKCPQLAPTTAEETRKAEVTDLCFKRHPIPAQLTERAIRAHTKLVMECALRADNWFDKRGRYRFSRAVASISGKQLPIEVETALIGHITQCRSEAERKFPRRQNAVDLVQLFQACMNFYTTNVCDIKLKSTESDD